MKNTMTELVELIDPSLEAELLQNWIEEQPEEPLVTYGDNEAVQRAFRAEVFGIAEPESNDADTRSQ